MSKVKASAKAIILKDNKFLLIKEIINNKEIWDIPGGKIEYGETPEKTAKREVKEELSLDIEIIKPAGTFWFFTEIDKTQIIAITFFCKAKNENVDLNNNPAEQEEITEYKWITKEELLKDDYYTGNGNFKEFISTLPLVIPDTPCPRQGIII